MLLQSLWGFQGCLSEAFARARQGGFQGIEVNLRHPLLAPWTPSQLLDQLAAAGLVLVLELVTGGDYVPDLTCSPAEHLHELECLLEDARPLRPLKVTVITGSDSWPWSQQQPFWHRALGLAARSDLAVSFETHRSRSLANPWSIGSYLEAFPQLRLTADLSHWCVVAERLMEPKLEPIQAMAQRVDHIHARVGHAQGPQVSHPFAPEHSEALDAHRRCWELFVAAQRQRGLRRITFTPEFGPDGYLPTLPFTNQPVADLQEINGTMARWLRQLFDSTRSAAHGARPGSGD
ncbi:MAG: sugar phosphate isomerase/epimerase [Cyanobium sp.]